MKTNEIVARTAFFTIIGALLAYYYELHLYCHQLGYMPSEARLSDDTNFIIPAVVFEVAFVALLWTHLFTAMRVIGVWSKIFLTPFIIFLGAISSFFLTAIIDAIGTGMHLFTGKDPFLFYSILALIYLIAGITSMITKNSKQERIVYYALLLHTCGLVLYRGIVQMPMGNVRLFG